MTGEWDVDPFETLTSESRVAILRALELPVDGGAVVGRDPLRIEVSETLDDERLTLVVSGDLDVVESRREAVPRGRD